VGLKKKQEIGKAGKLEIRKAENKEQRPERKSSRFRRLQPSYTTVKECRRDDRIDKIKKTHLNRQL
jgi:hypothetical protein